MNERIKQLAEQADEYADTKLQMPGEYHPDWHDVRDEKFAQLIVKECADIATINQYQSYTPGHYVLKHFGVE